MLPKFNSHRLASALDARKQSQRPHAPQHLQHLSEREQATMSQTSTPVKRPLLPALSCTEKASDEPTKGQERFKTKWSLTWSRACVCVVEVSIIGACVAAAGVLSMMQTAPVLLPLIQ